MTDELTKRMGPYKGKCVNGPMKGKTIASQTHWAFGYEWDWARNGWVLGGEEKPPKTP